MKNMARLLMACALMLVNACTHAQSMNPESFEAELKKQPDPQLLDVRTPGEYNEGHIKGAMQANIQNEQEFIKRVGALNKKSPVFVYCLSGSRSQAAGNWLESHGYAVKQLNGGINAWKQAGKPVEGTQRKPEIAAAEYLKMLNGNLVLADFGAEWCPPCRKLAPVISGVKQKFATSLKVVDIDGGAQARLMKTYNVNSLPTIILYKAGKEVWRADGYIAEKELEAVINKYLK